MCPKIYYSFFGKTRFLISTVAALCLFSVPSKIVLLLESTIFTVVALCVKNKTGNNIKKIIRAPAALLSASFLVIGVVSFYGIITAIIDTLVSEKSLVIWHVLCTLSTLLLGMIALPALGAFSVWIDSQICRIFEVSPENQIKQNVKANALLPISALAFFLLESRGELSVQYLQSVFAVFGIMMIVACRARPFLGTIRKAPLTHNVLCGITTLGICWFQYDSFCTKAIRCANLGMCLAVFSALFVFTCVSALYRRLYTFLSQVFADVAYWEWSLYGIIIFLSFVSVTAIFLKTNAFYGSEQPYDIIYTSDSPILVQNNAYLWLTYSENDLRQPLFALFAAPFMGIPYLLGKLFRGSDTINALLMNYPQILLLFTANFLLTQLMGLRGWKRVAFQLLSFSSYPAMLYCLVLEQYIFAYFYLILFLCSYCQNKPEMLFFCGASGSLLTSVVLLPLMSQEHPVQNFRQWIYDILNAGIILLTVLLAFGRLDILLNAPTSFMELNRFAGEGVSIIEKLNQYTAFVASCLCAPEAAVTENIWGAVSWQLLPACKIHWIGAAILVLTSVSAIQNRKKKSSILAVCWIMFSFAVLFVLGWGTKENGLILYSLYFGWAFWVLLYQMAEIIENTVNIKNLTTAIGFFLALVFSSINIPAIVEMVQFAWYAYPL